MTEQDEWVDYAACSVSDPEIFFSEAPAQIRLGKRICADCPVAKLCLQDSIETNERYGLRGGLLPHERRALRTRNARAA